MKIIALTDIHMATFGAESIAGFAQADLILLNGDLTNYGGVAETKKVLDALLSINPKILAQFGNLDRPEVNSYLEDLDINLHGQARLIGGEVCILGVGGSNYTPFNTPSEFSEKKLQEIADKAFQQGLEFVKLAEKLHNHQIPTIFTSHVPPYNTKVDRLHNGRHVGSTSIRKIIEQYQPDLCITGHIHEAKGTDQINQTPIYNPGMLKQGGSVHIEIAQSHLHVTLQ